MRGEYKLCKDTLLPVVHNQEEIEGHIRSILHLIGEDETREGLIDTPKRVAKMYQEIFAGYFRDSSELFSAVFESPEDQMIVVSQIPFYSQCEHHSVTFAGMCDVGYLPDGKVLGLSKFARLVDIYAKRLQIQERLTQQIADDIDTLLKPKGVMVVVKAEHLCMSMRGVKKPGTKTMTSVAKGAFRDNLETRAEFFELVKASKA